MREIPLTQGFVALVDDEDYERLQALPWRADKNGNVWYVTCWHPEKKRTVQLHREVLGLGLGDRSVDHINGDGLDNRKCNLRQVTVAQNAWNARRRSNKVMDLPKGVVFIKTRRKTPYRVTISKHRKALLVGYFPSVDSAAEAYRQAAKNIFGEYACTL